MKEDDFKKASFISSSALSMGMSEHIRQIDIHSKLQKAISPVNSLLSNSVLEKINHQNSVFDKLNSSLSLISNSAVRQVQMQKKDVANIMGPFTSITESIRKIQLADGRFNTQFQKEINPFENSFASSVKLVKMMLKENEFAVKYAKFHNQFNAVASAINPSISSILRENSRSNFHKAKSINILEALSIESFEGISDKYDDVIQPELESVLNDKDLKEEVNEIINAESKDNEIKIDIGEALGEFLEKYIAKKYARYSVLTIRIIVGYIIPIILYYKAIEKANLDDLTFQRIEFKLDDSINKENENAEKLDKLIELNANQMSPQEFADCKELFFDKMMGFVNDFEKNLKTKYKPPTVEKYIHIASAFVHYLHDYTSHIRFEEIKQSDTNSRFISTMKWDYLDDFDKTEIQSKMKAFLSFLKEQGLENDKIFK